MNWSAVWQDRTGTYYVIKIETENPYEPVFLINTRIHFKSFAEIYLDITNLLDVEYFDIEHVPMPGRWIRAGIKYTIE